MGELIILPGTISYPDTIRSLFLLLRSVGLSRQSEPHPVGGDSIIHAELSNPCRIFPRRDWAGVEWMVGHRV